MRSPMRMEHQITNTKKFARKKMPAARRVRVSCGYSAGGTGLVYGSCN